MVEKDLIPPGLTYLTDNITAKQNVLGASKAESSRWAKDLGLPNKSSTNFFAGCGYQYAGQLDCLITLLRRLDKSPLGVEMPMELAKLQRRLGFDVGTVYRKIATIGKTGDDHVLKDMVTVLRKLGVEPGYMADDEPCCGAPLHFVGMERKFVPNAENVQKQFAEYGVVKIISAVPSCTYALRDLIPQHASSEIVVEHFIEAVARLLSGHKLKYPKRVKVTYHDPCQLARFLEVVEAPRKVIRSIENLELVEPATSGQWATCCGGGGGFEAVFPELSQILASNRARELAETGAEIILTNCPGCIMQLEEGLRRIKATKVRVMDLAQVLALSLEV